MRILRIRATSAATIAENDTLGSKLLPEERHELLTPDDSILAPIVSAYCLDVLDTRALLGVLRDEGRVDTAEKLLMADAIRGDEKDKLGPPLLGRGGLSDERSREYGTNPSQGDARVAHGRAL